MLGRAEVQITLFALDNFHSQVYGVAPDNLLRFFRRDAMARQVSDVRFVPIRINLGPVQTLLKQCTSFVGTHLGRHLPDHSRLLANCEQVDLMSGASPSLCCCAPGKRLVIHRSEALCKARQFAGDVDLRLVLNHYTLAVEVAFRPVGLCLGARREDTLDLIGDL